MDQILNIVEQLQATNSRIEKENILKQHKDNHQWKGILYFIYNPYIVTGISKKKINKQIGLLPGTKYYLKTIEDVMKYLIDHNSGRDIDISHMESFYTNFEGKIQALIKQIITKDLSLGIDAKTINKVYDNYIPSFNVMLAHKYFDHEHKINGEFIITTKLDGIRCIAIKDNDVITLFSRQGQLIEGLVDVEEEMIDLPDAVYDGELILKNTNNLNSADLYRETIKVVRKDGIKHNVEFHIFDMVNIDGFNNDNCYNVCSTRKMAISLLLQEKKFQWIKEVRILYIGSDKSIIFKELDEAIKNGKEGVMVNVANALYECKRSDKVLKVKKMYTMDLPIVGFEEGTGKYKGMLGRLNVEYKDNIVGVGSGFTDKDRQYVWANKDCLMDKIVEVQYFEESQNKNGEKSLRFPIFKRFRPDKSEKSYD